MSIMIYSQLRYLNTDSFEEDSVPELIDLILILLRPVDDLVDFEADQLVDA